ncbi:MAG: PTS sugar transporter subunit IIA [Brevinema sp.]
MSITFNENLCFIEDSLTQEGLINKVAPVFINQGLVENDYAQALIAREQNFPTGFNLGFMGVAIPHVEAKYVKKSALWIASIKQGCTWKNAEDDDDVLVHLCFGLLLADSNKQIEFLQWVSSCFRDQEFLTALTNASSTKELYSMLEKRMKNDNILGENNV